MQISKYNWYLLLPANLIYTTSCFIFSRFISKGLGFELVNFIFITYILAFAILHSILTFKTYPQTPNKIFFRYNLFNLAVSLLINHFIFRGSPRGKEGTQRAGYSRNSGLFCQEPHTVTHTNMYVSESI